MKSEITISIIAPIYGVERYVAEFADSVLSQSYPNIEFIFVNDGTKDRSIEILEKLINDKYSHRRDSITIINKPNGGLPAARKTGLDIATGDYIYHVDSDDWLSPDSISKIVAKIEATDADVVYFNLVKEYAERSKPKRERVYDASTKHKYILNMYNHSSFSSLCNKCIRRTLYTDNVIYTPQYGYAEDCYLSTQLVGYASSISFLDEYIYHYRKSNPTAITSQQRRKRKREYALNLIDLYHKYHDVAVEKNPIVPILNQIVIQAGWYSMVYNLKLFSSYPWLAQHIRRAKICRGSNLLYTTQLITKLYALFK
ncbi:MAG: glycosyltransferase family 2 protein [Alistipes sp.]|nr:glycosyltransferase family 2 protein [Alistipes sp.]